MKVWVSRATVLTGPSDVNIGVIHIVERGVKCSTIFFVHAC